MRWSASQNRIAILNSNETKTGGYALLDIHSSVQISSEVSVRFGIDNILNTFHTEHLSVNAMPAPGRNVLASVRLDLK